MEALYREWIYLWYYCSIQFHQIFPYWVAGMVIGSLVSVFLKKHIHALMAALQTHSIGICGSGGFSLSAAQCDTRIKAVATLSMYDMNAATRLGMGEQARQTAKEQFSRQRWVDAENGYPEYIPSFPEQPIDAVPAELEEPNAEWFRFYALKRGHHPNARGGFTTTSNLAMMNFPLLAYIDEISPRPILFVVGDRAHSKFFSENACAAAKEPKELYTVADAEHIDLYDRRDRIPFDKLAEFFSSNLK